MVPGMSGDETPSLRERNKARAREEIAGAALQLFAQRGFADVTVDEIVTAAGVSRRTFFRYFETKEDALLSDYPELNVRLADSLRNGHAEDLMAAIRASLHRLADWYVERSEAVLARSRLIHDALAVAARNLEFFSQWEKAIAITAAQSMGVDPGTLVPRTIAAAVVGSFRAALSQWVRSSCREDLHLLTDQALEVVSAGLLAQQAGTPQETGLSR